MDLMTEAEAMEFRLHCDGKIQSAEIVQRLRTRIAELERDRELLVRLHAAWTYPNVGSIGSILDEVAERIEPGVFGDAAMVEERGVE